MSALWFKIFFGNIPWKADENLNDWLELHPNYEVVDYRMITQQDDITKHAIFITYRKKEGRDHEQSGDAESAEREE